VNCRVKNEQLDAKIAKLQRISANLRSKYADKQSEALLHKICKAEDAICALQQQMQKLSQ